MLNVNVVRATFDELEKIAGSLQGHVRSGRRPISAGRLLEKESEHQKVSDIIKTSAGKGALIAAGALGGMGLYHVGRRANEDRKLGRQIRLQQGGF